MTQEEWNACTSPGPMMGLLQRSGKTSERRCRLFACACVRRVYPLLPDAACRAAIESAERFADGADDVDALAAALAGMNVTRRLRGASAAARTACWKAAFQGRAASRVNSAYGGDSPYDWTTASRAAGHACQAAILQVAGESRRSGRPVREVMRAARDAERQAQAKLLRDIVGDPFRRPVLADSILA